MKPVESANMPKEDQPESISVQKPQKRFTIGTCVLLALAVFAVFGQTLRNGFINYDDGQHVYENPQVVKGLTLSGIDWAFTHSYSFNWHPLTWLSHMLDCQVYGLNAGGHHLTNVLLHAATTILLFLVLRRMMGLRADKSVGATATQVGALWPSAFVAAVFALHPLRVESVAWISERKDVLSGLFFMLTLLFYTRFAQATCPRTRILDAKPGNNGSGVFLRRAARYGGQGRPGSGDYWLALLFFALGLMSKPMLVTLPFVLLLLDYWPLNRFEPSTLDSDESRAGPQLSTNRALRLVFEKLPLFLLAAVSSVITFHTQNSSGAVVALKGIPLSSRLANGLVSYVAYILKMFWPDNLAVFYPYPVKVPTWELTVVGVFLLFGTVLAVMLVRRLPYFIVGWLWYLGMLVPVIGIVQVGMQSHADRYTYLPQIGLYLILAWAVKDLTGSWRYRRQVLGVAALTVIAALMVCAWKQTSYWRNSESLWTHALACTSDNDVAHNNLGDILVPQGRVLEAIEHFQKAIQINHADAEAYYNLAQISAMQGRLDEAIEQYQKAIQFKPDDTEARYNLGVVFGLRGRLDDAVDQYRKAIDIKTDYVDARGNLANVLAVQGRFDEAIREYQQTLELAPNSAQAHFRFGQALQAQHRFEAANAEYQKALNLDPKHLQVRISLAWLLATSPEASLRDGNKAVALAEQAKALAGTESPQLLDTLAAAYAEAGRFPEAVETVRRALNLNATKNNKPLADAIQTRLKLYEVNTPFHEKS